MAYPLTSSTAGSGEGGLHVLVHLSDERADRTQSGNRDDGNKRSQQAILDHVLTTLIPKEVHKRLHFGSFFDSDGSPFVGVWNQDPDAGLTDRVNTNPLRDVNSYRKTGTISESQSGIDAIRLVTRFQTETLIADFFQQKCARHLSQERIWVKPPNY